MVNVFVVVPVSVEGETMACGADRRCGDDKGIAWQGVVVVQVRGTSGGEEDKEIEEEEGGGGSLPRRSSVKAASSSSSTTTDKGYGAIDGRSRRSAGCAGAIISSRTLDEKKVFERVEGVQREEEEAESGWCGDPRKGGEEERTRGAG